MRVLLVANRAPASFVHVDRAILESAHSVDFVSFRWTAARVAEVVQFARKADAIVGWFAGHHTYLATLVGKLARKRVVIAASDYDLANEPKFDYGSMRGGIRTVINNQIFKCANRIVVPSRFSYELAVKNSCLDSMRDKLSIIPHGFEDPGFSLQHKERCTITVGTVSTENWIRKGHKNFVEAASLLPDVRAYLVGGLADAKLAARIRTSAAPNVILTGFLSSAELNTLLAKAKVYAQLSYMEGFGCSLAEAMLARCVPVVTPNGALPEVVGDCGFYVDYADLRQTCEAIHLAFADQTIGEQARQRVLECFPYERRRRELLQLISD